MSGDTNLAAAITHVNVFTHMKHLLWTTFPSLLVVAIVMFVAGRGAQSTGGRSFDKVAEMNNTLSQAFTWNVVMLLIPLLIILIGSAWKKPTIPVMLLSSAVAMFNAVVIQHFSVTNAFNAIVNGFDTSMLPKGFNLGPAAKDITSLLNRGGMESMMSTLLIAFCALSFAGVLSASGALNKIVESLLKISKSTGSLIVVTLLTGILTISTTCNGQVSFLLPGELLRPAYIRRGLHPCNLGRSIEDSGTIFEPILPWTAAGAYMAATLGVPTLSYMPCATLCWTGVIFATIWGYISIGIRKLTPDEQKTMLAELYKEKEA